jgi:hypothetical protein
MIATIIGLIFLLIILGVIVWAGQQLLALIPLGEPFATIIRILGVVLVVIIVVYVMIILLGIAGINVKIPSMN